MIDIHHHIIYGVDDGAKDFEMSCGMAEKAVKNDVNAIVCTSHCTPGHHKFKWDVYLSHLQKLQDEINNRGYKLVLFPGCEVLYTDDAPTLANKGEIPLLGQSRSMLVEFLPSVTWDRIEHAALDIGNAGLQMVVAHVERYVCLRDDMSLLEALHDHFGAYCQMNASTVIKSHGLFGDRWARYVLKNEYIDVVASDSHNLTSRSCQMSEARDVIARDYGKAVAKRLLVDTPKRILST